jgi:arginine:pyruvate transaminase
MSPRDHPAQPRAVPEHAAQPDRRGAAPADDIAAIGEVARAHDLWILSDEVYEEMVFDGTSNSLAAGSHPDLADRVVIASSISKSHAAPGFRSGWCVGPAEFCPNAFCRLAETMLFGNQPFMADATAEAVSALACRAGMAARFAAAARSCWPTGWTG